MKILLVCSRYPWPPRRGDQLRTVQMIDFLSAEHEVTVLAPEGPPGSPPPTRAPCRLETYRVEGRSAAVRGLARAASRRLPLQCGLFYQPDLRHRLQELAPEADLAILQLVRLAVHADDMGATPLVVDLIDSLSLNFSRRAQVDRLWLRPFLRVEARLLSIWEHRLLERAIAGLVVCERDRLALSRRRLLAPEVSARLSVVPIAVRVPHLPPTPVVDWGGRPVLILSGNLGYFVNRDAARWFLEHVWPVIRLTAPEVRLVVAGDRPAPSLRRALAVAGADLVESPPDLRGLLVGATVALAPMQCGSGLPLKVLEAWAAGVPVVASPWAAAGTAASPGVDLMVADQPGEWAQAILTLVRDPAARARLAEGGLARLRSSYSRREVRRQLLALFETPALSVAARRVAANAG